MEQGEKPRDNKGHSVAATLACVAGVAVCVCAALALGTLKGPAFLREHLPRLADELGVYVAPSPELERLIDGYGGELARRVAAVSAEVARSGVEPASLDEATAGAIEGLLRATDDQARYLSPAELEAWGTPGLDDDLVGARLMGQVGVVSMTSLEAGSSDALVRCVEGLAEQGAVAYVLDLRHASGGLVPEAVEVASTFLRGGTLAELRKPDSSIERVHANTASATCTAPLVVLVSPNTSGTAELVAAALREQGRCVLVGEKTAGRGVVQTLKTLSFSGSALFASAEFVTPDGHEVNHVGIEPDVEALPGIRAIEVARPTQDKDGADEGESEHADEGDEPAGEDGDPGGEPVDEDDESVAEEGASAYEGDAAEEKPQVDEVVGTLLPEDNQLAVAFEVLAEQGAITIVEPSAPALKEEPAAQPEQGPDGPAAPDEPAEPASAQPDEIATEA